ncbi:inter-alpha-trypsin inhibitor heavy chain H3-like isoform X1 [Bufo bufo]|uniref:inter-alpha-trypsin inhibitor heavy chain H3-like isoform X1 n=1 Tax=Bufo bufo TaxID=8384 RepID=UPI001ABDE1C0|nr:inter-alpha-trypsin inhibitor heavy chain H3-like isoform X1 [Bufo bufo]
MDQLLLVFTLLFYVLSPINGDFLIEGRRGIQKRSTDRPVKDIEFYRIDISSQVTSRFAHNVITSRAVNRANISKEAIFDVDLPKTAFITNFSMIIDGVTYSGVIKEKEAAKKQYEKAVSRGQTAGLVRASGRKTEKFTVSVNVAPESKVTFELVYEEMLKRRLGKYEMFIKVQPKTLVKSFQIEVDIYEGQGISFLDAQASFITNDLQSAIKKSIFGEQGHVSFKPTIDQQRSCANCDTTLLDGDFTVTYDVNRQSPGNIQVVNGYFVHFFAPSKLPSVTKNVIYIIDKSGSMIGQKMEQTKQALLRILNDTAQHDHFNFILFSDDAQVWKDSLVKATPENLEEARTFVKSIIPDGLTNINSPVLMAVEQLNKAHELKIVPERSVSLIILLTDGDPNTGESNPAKIQENAKKAIQGKYTLYSLGFGQGVNYPFLEKLALENSGIARRIYEDSDADLQLQGFYTEIANPTLIDIEMQYPENAIADLTQNNFRHYFEGSEIVVAGRVTDNDLNSFIVDVKAKGADASLKYTENVQLQEKDDESKQQKYIFGDFTERLWAYLTIQELLEKRLHADPSEKVNLTAQVLELSLKFKFVTPLTSMVVTKPEEESKVKEEIIADKFVESTVQRDFTLTSFLHKRPPHTQGSANWVDSDPHFVINVPQKNDALCFNIQEEPGVILNLVEDRERGISVNGELIGKEKAGNNARSNQTYFGRLGIINRDKKIRIEVTTDKITVLNHKNKKTLAWQKKGSISKEGFNLVINKKANLTLSFGEGATFFIILHEVWKNHPVPMNFLGFYTVDDHTFSKEVHGLLGQFFHGIDYEISNLQKNEKTGKQVARMNVKNKQLTVTRSSEKDYKSDPRKGIKTPCWFVNSNGEGLIDGTHTDYIVPDIFSFAYQE